jgi:hypothetical protein
LANKNIYLVANYVARPKDPKKTNQAGYITNPDNIQYDEQVFVARGFRDRYMQNSVVLDLTEEKIIKNSFTPNKTFEEIFKHYHDGFSEYIEQSVNDLNADHGISNN